MVTKRKSDLSKTAGAFRRAFSQAKQALPGVVRQHWLTILFPVRLLPQPVALALIALFALVIILNPSPSETAQEASTIGGTDVPLGLHCQEDEVIGFVGIPDTLVCIHYENLAEQDAGGCIRPAFYVEAADRCVLVAVPPASTPAATVTSTVTATTTATVTATISSPIGAPSAGMPTIDAR